VQYRPRHYKTAEVLTEIFNDSDSNDESDSDDSDGPTFDLESRSESDVEDSDEDEEEVVQQSSSQNQVAQPSLVGESSTTASEASSGVDSENPWQSVQCRRRQPRSARLPPHLCGSKEAAESGSEFARFLVSRSLLRLSADCIMTLLKRNFLPF